MHPGKSFLVKLLALALAGSVTASTARGEAAFSLHPQTATRTSDEIASEVARLTSELSSGDEEERRSAVLTLAALETPAARGALIAALADRSERVRAAAVTALGRFADPQLATTVAPLATKDKSVFVRKSAAYALGRMPSPAATVALISALRDKDIEVRGAAAVALGDYPDSQAVEPLTAALTDKSEFVRAQAARALGTNALTAARTVPALIRVLTSDPELEPKRQAAVALGQIGDRSALPALEAAQRDPDPHLSAAALASIERIKRQ